MVGDDRRGRVAREAAFALAGLIGLVAVAFSGVLFRGRTLSAAAYVPGILPSGPVLSRDPPLPPPVRDVEGAAWVDEPQPYLVHRQLAAGGLPLWNAAEGLGAPLAGNPNSGAWAPLQWPVNLWPTPLVQDVAWVVRVLVLGAFTWLLAWELGCGPVGSLAAAAALMLSGQTVEWIVHHPLNTDAFVPLALAAGARIARGGGAIGLLALATALGLLGVKPQSALVAGTFGLLWLLGEVADQRHRLPRATPGVAAVVARWGAGVALGVGCASIALLPFAETFRAASALVQAGRSAQSEWTLAPAALPALAGPGAMALWRALGGSQAAASPWPPYVGAVVLGCAFVGLWRKRRSWLGAALAATVALYLLKVFGGIASSLGDLPLLGSINFVKYCFPLYLALALLAGFGLASSLNNGDDGARSRGPLLRLAVLAALAAELCWLVPGERPPRIDPYRPAPYVDVLRGLVAAEPGRISGPVDLLPPLVSAVAGFRDLRAIDVLTPGATYDFVTRFVAPSQGLTWILADPSPLLVATAPAAGLADVRYVLSRSALDAAELPAAVRSMTSARRLNRLFSVLERYDTSTRTLGGGLDERGGDRRFHWTCETPCRMRFVLREIGDALAVGFTASRAARVQARVRVDGDDGVRREAAAALELGAEQAEWQDLWLEAPQSERDGAAARRSGGTLSVELTSAAPAEVFIGGIGPSPGAAAERAAERDELAARTAVFAGLRERYADATARVYENPSALGEAFFAPGVVRARDAGEMEACLSRLRETPVACVAASEVGDAPSAGEARVVASDEGEIAIATRSASGGLLVISRLLAPGWSARLDGKAISLVGVDSVLMGVVVPPGEHRVAVAYTPRSLAAGAAASAFAIAVSLWVGWRESAAARRRPRV